MIKFIKGCLEDVYRSRENVDRKIKVHRNKLNDQVNEFENQDRNQVTENVESIRNKMNRYRSK